MLYIPDFNILSSPLSAPPLRSSAAIRCSRAPTSRAPQLLTGISVEYKVLRVQRIIHRPFIRSRAQDTGSPSRTVLLNIISHHITSHHTTSHHITSHHITSYHITDIISYHTISYHIIPYHTIPYHTIPYHTIPYHTIPYHTIPYHTIPYHIISYHIIPYII